MKQMPASTTDNKAARELINSSKPRSSPEIKADDFFTDLFKKYPQLFDTIISQAVRRNIQIIYTQINRGANNSPRFKDFYFNVDAANYFYPASTVKMPAAVLALQRINELTHTGITMNTTMLTEAAYSGQTTVNADSTAYNGKPSLKQYIKKIFLVSDNDAFNRIYEFLGQEYLNEQLHKKGYPTAQILHRLDIFLSEEENRHTNPVTFLADNNSIVYRQPLVYNRTSYQARNELVGKAHYKGDSLIKTPMNFSKKNRLTLHDLHGILRSVMLPESVPEKQRFRLTPGDYKFLYQCLSEYPAESKYPAYDKTAYPDFYVKFLMEGINANDFDKNVRVFSKSGEAYGQLTDIAYVVDFDKNIEFFLSATINCAVDGVINSDNYDYQTAGYPFLKSLGKVIYDVELNRKRGQKPDLTKFKVKYD